MNEPARRPREVREWVICEETGQQAINGLCPAHHGDACLIAVGWVDRSHVRRELADVRVRLWRAEASARAFTDALRKLAARRPLIEAAPGTLGCGFEQIARDALAAHPEYEPDPDESETGR